MQVNPSADFSAEGYCVLLTVCYNKIKKDKFMSGKNYKSFKDYIEKRTVADVMSDYTEQKDEWEELPLAKTDKKSDADSKTKNIDA